LMMTFHFKCCAMNSNVTIKGPIPMASGQDLLIE
jgi:hypothetical protein